MTIDEFLDHLAALRASWRIHEKDHRRRIRYDEQNPLLRAKLLRACGLERELAL